MKTHDSQPRISRLLVVHGLIRLGAAIVLIIAPGLIPRTVGSELDPRADLIAYLLAGAEIGFSVPSFAGSRVSNARALGSLCGGHSFLRIFGHFGRYTPTFAEGVLWFWAMPPHGWRPLPSLPLR